MNQLGEYKKNLHGDTGRFLRESLSTSIEKRIGLFDPGLTLFYLIRRFGFPLLGCDEYKELLEYRLTTSDKDIFLTVSPKPKRVSFGYLSSEEHQEKIDGHSLPADKEWYKAFIRHLKTKYPVSKRRLTSAKKIETGITEDEMWDETKYFIEINPKPRCLTEENPHERYMQTVLLEAARELTRPIRIRDTYFTPLAVGDQVLDGLPYDEEEGFTTIADYHDSAGLGLLFWHDDPWGKLSGSD